MPDRKMIRRISDGMVFEAIRYGREDGSWDQDCITEVAAFILGFDPDVGTTVANERMLDVVKPVLKDFDPIRGKADIQVADWTSGRVFTVMLGDWVLKNPNVSFILAKQWAIDGDFEDVPKSITKRNETDELANFIYDYLPFVSPRWAKAVAQNLAAALIRAGWSKKESL